MSDLGAIDWSQPVLMAQAGPPASGGSSTIQEFRMDTTFPENGYVTIPDGCTHFHNTSVWTTYGTTLTLPLNPIEGQFLLITSLGNVQALRLNGNGINLNNPAHPDPVALSYNGSISFRYSAAQGWVVTQYNPNEINSNSSARTFRAYGTSGFKWSYPNASYDIYANPGNFWMQGTNAGTRGRPNSLKITLQSTLDPDDPSGTDYRDVYMGLSFSMVNVSGRWGNAAISALSAVGNVVTATTSNTAGMVVGQVVAVSGATPAVYNGNATITAILNSTQFTYVLAAPPGMAGSGAMKWTAIGDRPLGLNLITVPSNTRPEGTDQTWPNFGTGVGAHVFGFAGGPLRIGRTGGTGFEMMKFDDLTGNATLYKAYANVSEQRSITNSSDFTIANNLSNVVLAGTGVVRITMPVTPIDGQVINITLETNYSAVTLAPNVAQTLVLGVPLTATAGSFATFRYRAANKKWLRVS
jgi:hypothetical protein